MSSPQVLDSAKMEAQLERFFRDADREKHHKATESALAKQRAVVEGMDGNFLITDAAAQQGRPLARQELIKRLKSINPNLEFEQSKTHPHVGGIYIRDGISNMDKHNYRGMRYVAAMEWTDFSPEFIIIRTVADKWGEKQPRIAKMSWRTILKRLIKARLISVPDVERVFLTNHGRESERWSEEIY